MSGRRRLLLGAALCAAWPRHSIGADGDERTRRSRDWFTDTVLVDQDGQAHRLYSDLLAPARPRVTVMHALFTGCSSACPLIVQKLAQLRQAVPESRRRELWFLSLSVDPLSDTPPHLKAFADRQGVDVAEWRFLTGALPDVERVTRRLGLWTDTPDEHQTTLIAGRASAAHWAKLKPDASAPALAQQLERFWERPVS